MQKRILSLLVLLMTAVTGAWAQEVTLLTTIESEENESFTSGSKTFDNKATVTFSGKVYNDGDDEGWYSGEGQGYTLTVTAAEGYTITRVKFYNYSDSASDEDAPFEAIFVDSYYEGLVTEVNGTPLGAGGVNKIEVYGYETTGAGATNYTTLAVGDVIKVGDTFSPTAESEGAFNNNGVENGETCTLIRADVDNDYNVTEKTDGAYYVFKSDSGWNPYIHFEKAFAVTAISDGLEVTNIENIKGKLMYTLALHESAAPVAVTGVTLSPTSASLTVGDAVALTAAVAPADATDKKVKWSVTSGSDKVKLYKDADCNTEVGTEATDVLTVYAKGIAAGEATVKVESNADATKSATCTVTAVAKTWTSGDCTVTFSDGVMTVSGTGAMADYADYNYTPWSSYDVETIVIESSVTSIGKFALSRFRNLESVSIPASVTSIGERAFENCGSEATALTVSFAEGSTPLTIGESAFEYSNLKSIDIPNRVTSIGNSAFYNCSKLESVSIPASVTSIGEEAFENCGSNATALTVSFAEGSTPLTIGESAFYNANLKSIDIPNRVTSIGNYAFQSCSNLESVSIPASVTSIGERAFCYCSKLAKVSIYAPSLTTYGADAFKYNATGRKIYVLPKAVDTYKAGWPDYAADIEAMPGYGYTVTLKSGTEDATKWQGKADTGDYQALPLTGVEAGTAVTVKYFGTKKVESVKAVKALIVNPYATAKLGDLFYSDGTFSSTLEAGKTPIGVIAYLGTDAFSENGTTVGGSAFVGHGLVMCLKNAASAIAWSTENVSKFIGQEVSSVEGLKRTENVSGYTNTATLTVDEATAAKYPAAAAAKNYTELSAPTGTTGWFLPSAQQWVKMMEGLGGLSDGAPNYGESFFDNNHTAADKWEAALSEAGSGNYDSMTSKFLWYWSSSECSADNAVYLSVDAKATGDSYGFWWDNDDKGNAGNNSRVRPVLAF